MRWSRFASLHLSNKEGIEGEGQVFQAEETITLGGYEGVRILKIKDGYLGIMHMDFKASGFERLREEILGTLVATEEWNMHGQMKTLSQGWS